MANKKITELNEASSITSADWLVMVDTGNDETKKIHPNLVGASIPVQDTAPANPSTDDLWIDTSEEGFDNSKVVNEHSTSISDAYSCNYVNDNIIKCKTTSFTPTYSASSTSQGGYFATSLDTKTISGLGNSDTILSAYVTPVGYQASYNFFIQEFKTDFSQFGVYCSSQAQLILTVLYK